MKPLLLLTNDDGAFSPGLLASMQALAPLGELLIVAPRYQQTGMGRSFPMAQGYSCKIEEFPCPYGRMYGVHGSPAQAVAHAVLELASRKPDFCISGINYGENLGTCVTCSGTLGAAFEANTYGISSLAVSRQAPVAMQKMQHYPPLDWTAAIHFSQKIAISFLAGKLAPPIPIWNVNIPEEATVETAIRFTQQSNENCFHFTPPSSRNFSTGHRLTSEFCLKTKLTPNDDAYAFYIDKVVSITPLSANMTASFSPEYFSAFDGSSNM